MAHLHGMTWDYPRGFRFPRSGVIHTMRDAWTGPRDAWFLGFVDDVCEILPDLFAVDRDETGFLKEINALYRRIRANWA